MVGQRLTKRIEESGVEVAVTIITVEEQMRGWLAEIGRHADPRRQISAYAKLHRQFEVFADWMILQLDAASADLFLNLRRQGVRIGSMDLKIACIALVHNAALASRNSRDFAQVPGLRLENWLD